MIDPALINVSAGAAWLEEHLNEVDVDSFSREGKSDEISRQENPEEKTLSETVLAVADRVYSRQGIARSILIQSVLVKSHQTDEIVLKR